MVPIDIPGKEKTQQPIMAIAPTTVSERIRIRPRPIGQGEASRAFALEDILRALRQRIFMIFFIWIAFFGMAGAGTYLLWTKYPLYRAEAQLLVESPNPNMPFQLGENENISPNVLAQFQATQALLATSTEVVDKALLDAGVKSTEWYKSTPSEERRQRLKDDITVAPVRGTNVLFVRMETRSRQDPHIIANALAAAYLTRANQLAKTEFQAELEEYNREETITLKLLEDQAKDIENHVSKMAPGVASGSNPVLQQVLSVTEQLTATRLEMNKMKALWDSYRESDADQITVNPTLQRELEIDPRIAALEQQLQSLKQALVLKLDVFGEEHKQVKDILRAIKHAEDSLFERRTERVESIRSYLIEQSELGYLSLVDQVDALNENYLELIDTQQDIDLQMIQLERLQDQKRLIEEKYNRLEGYTNNLGLIVKESSTMRIKSISPAQEPLERSFPNWFITMPVGFILGFGIAVSFALFLEIIDTSVRSPQDLTRQVNVAMLGSIPDLDDEEVDIDEIETAVRTAPHSMVAEAFRTIRTNLAFSAPVERQRSILITSPKPEDGKTAVAVNLATIIAQSGRRVLLVDSNFRRPTIHRIFHQSTDQGLSNILVGQAGFDDLVQRTDLPNLDVLCSGPIPPNPAELLSSSYMRNLVNETIDKYDQVIFDGPPVLLVSDSLVLSTMVDGVILVCRAKANSRGVASRSRDLLARVEAHVFGAILNAVQVRRGGYYREQFRTFYEYRPEEETKRERNRKEKKLAAAAALPARTGRDNGDKVVAPVAEEGYEAGGDDIDLGDFGSDVDLGDFGKDVDLGEPNQTAGVIHGLGGSDEDEADLSDVEEVDLLEDDGNHEPADESPGRLQDDIDLGSLDLAVDGGSEVDKDLDFDDFFKLDDRDEAGEDQNDRGKGPNA